MVEFVPFESVKDLDNFVQRRISTDPSLKIQKAKVQEAEFSLNTYSYTPTESYKSRETTMKTEQRTYAESVKDMEASIRAGYNSIIQLEANQKSLEAALETAETTLKTAEINLQVGNITQLQYEQAKLGVESARAALQKNIFNHDMLKFTINKPYMLMAA